eukprot:Rmarinus@m.7371
MMRKLLLFVNVIFLVSESFGLVVESPKHAAGVYPHANAAFGSNLSQNPVRGIAVFTALKNGCSPLDDPGIDQNILVVYRGECTFSEKAAHAVDAGAIGMIVINQKHRDLIAMARDEEHDNVDIPLVLVQFEVGEILAKAETPLVAMNITGAVDLYETNFDIPSATSAIFAIVAIVCLVYFVPALYHLCHPTAVARIRSHFGMPTVGAGYEHGTRGVQRGDLEAALRNCPVISYTPNMHLSYKSGAPTAGSSGAENIAQGPTASHTAEGTGVASIAAVNVEVDLESGTGEACAAERQRLLSASKLSTEPPNEGEGDEEIAEERRASPATSSGGAKEPSAGTRSSEADQGNEVDVCSICLDDFSEGDSLRRLPCGHYFHQPCVDKWFGSRLLCPLCKRHVLDTSASGSQGSTGDPDLEMGEV